MIKPNLEDNAQNSAVTPTNPLVRPYRESDLKQLISLYKSAFAEPPWDEFMKCSSCGVNYGRDESQKPPETCKNEKCTEKLKLIEFWSSKEITEDLDFANSQPEPIILVAENNRGLVGMTWGYQLPFEKFPFLEGRIDQKSNYIDEIAVAGDRRLKGIGTLLGKRYLQLSEQKGIRESVLRTDQRNTASIALFKKLGFRSLGIYDPQYADRIYLSKKLGELK